MSEHPLDPVFHPRAIAIVGVSTNLSSGPGDFLAALLDQKYQERRPIYPVNPKAREIRGLQCYPSLLDCPDPVDHVISMIPRSGAPLLVDQCIQKGVRSLHFFTAGFSESGDPEMAATERAMATRARAAGMRIIGPNCLGLYVPEERIAFHANQPTEPGSVMGISQSGANAGEMIWGLGKRGIRFSKVVSFGNGSDLAAPELFEYAAADSETQLIVSYLESVRDGRALFEAIKSCARVKPTIILKGGFTAAGARAANSHTGALAGSGAVFDALCRQAGAVRVETLDELQDLAIAVSTGVRRIRGNRSILVGSGGGFSVLAADAIAKHGIDLPELPGETQQKLRPYVPVAGNSVRNPIDAGFIDNRRETVERVTEIAAFSPGYDFVFARAGDPWRPDRPELAPRVDDAAPPVQDAPTPGARHGAETLQARFLADLQRRSGRPMVVLHRGRESDHPSAIAFTEEAYGRDLGVFFTVPRAARAVQLLLEWRARRAGLPQLF